MLANDWPTGVAAHLLASQHVETGDRRRISKGQASLGYAEDPVSKTREEVRKNKDRRGKWREGERMEEPRQNCSSECSLL